MKNGNAIKVVRNYLVLRWEMGQLYHLLLAHKRVAVSSVMAEKRAGKCRAQHLDAGNNNFIHLHLELNFESLAHISGAR